MSKEKEQNRKDLSEIPDTIKRRVKYIPVKDIDEFLNIVFPPEKAARKTAKKAAAKKSPKRRSQARK